MALCLSYPAGTMRAAIPDGRVGVMRGTVPHPHEVIQPAERKPPNPDGVAGCGQLREKRPVQLR
jgi:hypothetical protein